ncbi:MAG: SCO1664 family protein [Actinobacteria bacterium]|nr:SCO1664 family protein [Actinomycetota bacterium]
MDRSPSERCAARLLRDAELELLGVLAGASNHTLLVRLNSGDTGEDRQFAVYKPQRGERPLWDFPAGTLCRREVAAYRISAFLGWGLVPPTVLRAGPLGMGSVQQFVLHDPAEHYFTLVEDPARHDRLAQLATFDLLVNNADRKGGHVLRVVEADRLVGIDHGLTFHVQPKLRTVIWELGGRAIRDDWRADVRRLATSLGDGDIELVADLLDSDEVAVLQRRAELLADRATLPDPPHDRRPYPWPPV